MISDPTRFTAAIEAFDAANAEDPHQASHDGSPVPAELLYARRMTEWLGRLYPDAAEPLRLAARAQHIRRWRVPRAAYPMDRIGYLRWRTDLYSFHAAEAETILRGVGYDDAVVGRVRSLLRKERIKADPEMQALEDVACIVFLEDELADFAARHAEGKLIHILRRTWAKMSPHGHEAALALPLPAAARALVEKALAGD